MVLTDQEHVQVVVCDGVLKLEPGLSHVIHRTKTSPKTDHLGKERCDGQVVLGCEEENSVPSF